MPIDFFDIFTDRLLSGKPADFDSRGFNMASAKTYPLKNDNKYLGRITFEVVDEKPGELPEDLLNLWGTVTGTIGGFLSGIFGLEEADIGEFKGLNNITTAPAEPTNFPAAQDFGKITLYLPQALNIQDAVSYDNNVQLGRIGGIVEGGLNSEQGASELGRAIGQGAAETLGALAGGQISPTVASIMAQNRAKTVGLQGASDAVKGSTQVALNPNTRTLFQSVPIRQFSFSFTLIATSKPEADEIENIIEAFRTELYPEEISVGGVDYAYKFPRRFLIRASYDDKEWRGIKFLPCYMQSFIAQYNPNGMGFHKDGKFTEVQITMSFSESKALAKQDIKVGY